jgi:biotin transporter BioY
MTNLLDPSTLPKIAPIVFFLGCGGVAVCMAIVLQRCFCSNMQPSIYIISSLMAAISTTFFYLILWLVLTILSPMENHFAQVLIALIITGYIPTIILAVLGYKPNRHIKESKNEINYNDEITND